MSDIPNQQNIDQEREASQNPARQQQSFKPINIANNYNLSKKEAESFTRKFEHGAQRVAIDQAIRLENQQNKKDQREINIKRDDILTEATHKMASGEWGNDQESVIAGAIAWHEKTSRERHANGQQIITPADLNNIINRGKLIHTKTKGQLLYEEASEGLNSRIDQILSMRDKDEGKSLNMESELRSDLMGLLEQGVEKSQVDGLISFVTNAVALARGDEVAEEGIADDNFRNTTLRETLVEIESIMSGDKEGKEEAVLQYLQNKELELRSKGTTTEKQMSLFASVTGRFRETAKDIANFRRESSYNILNGNLQITISGWVKEMQNAKTYDDAISIYSDLLNKKLEWYAEVDKNNPNLAARHRGLIRTDMFNMFQDQVGSVYNAFRMKETRQQDLITQERATIRFNDYNDPERRYLDKLARDIRKRDLELDVETYEDRIEAQLQEEQDAIIAEYRKQHQGLKTIFTVDFSGLSSVKINNAVSGNFSTSAAYIVQNAISFIEGNPLHEDGKPIFTESDLILGGSQLTEYFTLLSSNFTSAIVSAQDSVYTLDDKDVIIEPEDQVLEEAMNNVYPQAVETTLRALQERYEAKALSPAMYQYIKENIKKMENPLGSRVLSFNDAMYSNGIRITTPPRVQVLDLENEQFYDSAGKFLGPPIPEGYNNAPILQYGDSYFVQKEDGMHEIDNRTPEGKMIINLYNYAAEEEADFWSGMIQQERQGDPIQFLMSDITGNNNNGLLKNLVGVPLFSPEIVGEDMPVPKSRWDRMVDTAFDKGMVNTKEAETLETLKGMMFSMSQEQGLKPYDKDLKENIDKVLRAAVEMLYSKSVEEVAGSGVFSSFPYETTTEYYASPELLEKEFFYIRSPETIQKDLEELLEKYRPTDWRGNRVEHKPFTFFSITLDTPVETTAVQPTTGEEEAPPAKQADSVTASRGMRTESTGFGAVAKEIETAEENSRFLVR